MRKLAALILTAGLMGPVLSQNPPTTLDQTKQLQVVAAQKLESEVRAALREAAQLQSADRTQAIEKLKAAQSALESDQALPSAKKSTLLRVVQDRLRVIELGPDTPEQIAQLREAEQAKQVASKAEAIRTEEEKKKIKEGLDAVAKLRKDGKTAEAEKLVAELSGKYPGSFALQVLTGRASFERAAQTADKDRKDAEPKFVAAMRDVDKSATPVLNDVTFPDDWKERTAKRRDGTAPTEQEKALLRSLETVIDARYKNSKFQDVMDHISTATGRTIIVDASALAETNVNYETSVNFTTREPIASRTALRSVLAQLSLTYVVRDGIIHVTTPTKARDLMTTRVYYLGDLVTGLGPYGGLPTIGMANDQIQVVQNISALVEMVTSAIDPMSWEKRGGQGHLGFNLPTLSLTVRQSQEVHVMLRASLYGTKK